MKKICLLLPFLFINFISFAQQSKWLWALGSDLPSFSSDANITSSAVDKDNFGYEAGVFFDTLIIGNDTLIDPYKNNSQCYIAKFDSNGNVIWARQSKNINPGNGIVTEISVITDSNNNVYITGNFADSISFGSYHLTNIFSNLFLVKYDKNGNVKWAKQSFSYGRLDSAEPSAITCDKFNTIYVSGSLYDTVSFDTTTYSAIGQRFFVAKYDSNGNILNIIQPSLLSSSGKYNDEGISLSVDPAKNIYLLGGLGDTIIIGNDTLWASYGGGNTAGRAFIAKYDSNGKVLWTRQSSGSTLGATGIVTSNDYSVYVTGSVFDSTSIGNVKIYAPSSSLFLIKFDSAGNSLWGKVASCPDSLVCLGYSIVTDSLNHIYICGVSEYFSFYTDIAPDTIVFNSDTLVGQINSDDGNSILYKLDTDGNVLCSAILDAGGFSENFIAVNRSGSCVYFEGNLYTPAKIANDSLVPTSGSMPFAARWNACLNISSNVNVLSISNYQSSIYPNPTSGQFTIRSTGNQNGYTIEVYNVMGEKIYQSVLSNSQSNVDLSNQPAGMYFVYLKSDEDIKVGKVIVTK